MLVHGACHCGNITFDLEWPDGVVVQPRACSCTFCQKHGATWTAHPDAVLSVRIVDAARAARYRFGTRTADFHVCATCGVVPLCTGEMDGRLHAVVNTRTFEGIGPLPDPVVVDFEGEQASDRLGRRARHWIARVTLAS
ncbi:hypothetical protein KPL74_09680 [Bacillus sp. NP157]|nr:hypothetical protein KPL74_09680 [Bacillus sp. NP157]